MKMNFLLNIFVLKLLENGNKIFIFMIILGCIGFVLLIIYLIVYIIEKRC